MAFFIDKYGTYYYSYFFSTDQKSVWGKFHVFNNEKAEILVKVHKYIIVGSLGCLVLTLLNSSFFVFVKNSDLYKKDQIFICGIVIVLIMWHNVVLLWKPKFIEMKDEILDVDREKSRICYLSFSLGTANLFLSSLIFMQQISTDSLAMEINIVAAIWIFAVLLYSCIMRLISYLK